MEFKEIAQVNVTLVAGLLVLLGISSVAHSTGSEIYLLGSIVLFATSIVFAVLGSFTSDIGRPSSREKRIAHYTLVAGVIYLTISVMLSLILGTPKIISLP